MKNVRWIPESTQSPSLTCLPEAVVQDIVLTFLSEREAFEARGICFLFSTAYFNQSYTDAHNLRVLAMISKGYEYRKLEKIFLEFNMLQNLGHLRNLPALKEFTCYELKDFELETMPTNLVHLRKLSIT